MTLARVAASAALATAMPLVPAHAACDLAGTNLTCTGTTVVPVELELDGLDITNSGDVTINEDEDAFNLEVDDNTVTNSGSISATVDGNEAIQADGGIFTLTNSGSIAAADKGVQVEAFGATILNSGSVSAGSEGIEATDGVTITNTATGTVEGAEDGIRYGSGSFTNFGNVIGGSSGDGDAIDIDSGMVTNNGTLTSLGAGSAGIDVDEVTVDAPPSPSC